ncbi:PaaX family transcriptional regulator C-terminal domain-containing protein [Paeniglutamicibacter sp. NPDC091659]|uniref:PaaX family transcriptional regulator n=1 Tax=Paeniglutamicibacter sp. NPDC091659 TaxID=3364389 RepID=UPI003825D206
MNPALDDLDARPGSTTSLVRTIVGLYIRELGGWISSTHLISLMDTLGTSAQVTRTAITRLKKKGILEPRAVDGVLGFALTDAGERILARGDRRIFEPRSMEPGDPWCLLSYSVPEAERERRHQLRRHLQGIGGGLVAPGLWIFPEYLRAELWEILQALELQDHATVFVSQSPEITGSMRDAASTWWDLESLAALHHAFIALNHAVPESGAPEASESFATYVRAIDSWRTIPYLDPGLPPQCLPEKWPGRDSAGLFLRIQASHASPARGFVQALR